VALSALWLNQFFPRAGASREVLYPLRLVFGVAMVVTIVLGFRSARRRDFARHRAWMTRSYAIGLVAGTQVFTLGLGGSVFGHGPVTTALLMGAAWGITSPSPSGPSAAPPTAAPPVVALHSPQAPGELERSHDHPPPRRTRSASTATSTTTGPAWLGDLTLVRQDDGTTVLTGPITDQAQLHGVLAAVRDLGVPLLSLQARGGAAKSTMGTRGVDAGCPSGTRPPAAHREAHAPARHRGRRGRHLDVPAAGIRGSVADRDSHDQEAYRVTFADPGRLASTVVVELNGELIGVSLPADACALCCWW
jgi:hypothetical protein